MTDDSNYAKDDYDDGMMLLKTPAAPPTNIENKMFAGKIPNPLLVSNPDPVERQCMMQTNMREREEDGYNQDICVGVASTCLRTVGSTTSSLTCTSAIHEVAKDFKLSVNELGHFVKGSEDNV